MFSESFAVYAQNAPTMKPVTNPLATPVMPITIHADIVHSFLAQYRQHSEGLK